ncbi:MAG TPA: YfiR family protein [Polyangiales bacterium]
MSSRAQDALVPIALQIELVGRLLWYERGLQKSADRQLRALILERPRDPASARAAAQLASQLQGATLGGRQVTLARVSYESVEQVARAAQQQRAYLAWLTPGFGELAGELGRALGTRGVLTISSHGADTARGVVLGFELESGKPRIMLNLKQARAQKLDFSAQLLRVVKVVP